MSVVPQGIHSKFFSLFDVLLAQPIKFTMRVKKKKKVNIALDQITAPVKMQLYTADMNEEWSSR